MSLDERISVRLAHACLAVPQDAAGRESTADPDRGAPGIPSSVSAERRTTVEGTDARVRQRLMKSMQHGGAVDASNIGLMCIDRYRSQTVSMQGTIASNSAPMTLLNTEVMYRSVVISTILARRTPCSSFLYGHVRILSPARSPPRSDIDFSKLDERFIAVLYRTVDPCGHCTDLAVR